jgi:uncharacterized membrane protein
LLRKTSPARGDNQAYLRFLALGVLIPYFLFTSGFVFEVAKSEVTDVVDIPYSIALSSYRVDIAGVFNRRDGAGADWLVQRLGDEHIIYADVHSNKLLGDRTELRGRRIKFPENMGELPPDSYIYFRTWNIDKQEITFWTDIGLRRPVSFDKIGLTPIIEARNRIYDNGGAQVLAPR